MTQSSPSTSKQRQDIDQFLQRVARAPAVNRNSQQGRLIFAMDATASRKHTWDSARRLQSDMFTQASQLNTGEGNGLDIRLIFFRGYGECKSSAWINNPDTLHRLMKSVHCLAGSTQIERVLLHAIAEAQQQDVQALVYVGDCIEENIDRLGRLAGELSLLKVQLFIFQEGNDPDAHRGFAQLARISGGVHCRFAPHSAEQLGTLLNAAALFATGGKQAVQRYSVTQSAAVKTMLQQIK